MFTELFETLIRFVMDFELANLTRFFYLTAQTAAMVLLIVIILILVGLFGLLVVVILTCPTVIFGMWIVVIINLLVAQGFNLLVSFLLYMDWPEPACSLDDSEEECKYTIVMHVFTVTSVYNFLVVGLYKLTVYLVIEWGYGRKDEDEKTKEKTEETADGESNDKKTSESDIESEEDSL